MSADEEEPTHAPGEAPYELRSHIGDLAGTMPGEKFSDTDYAVANGIFNDPETHLKALVDSGVLEPVRIDITSTVGETLYRIKVQP